MLEKHSLNKIRDTYLSADDSGKDEMPTVKLLATFKDPVSLYFLTEMFRSRMEVWEHCRTFGFL